MKEGRLKKALIDWFFPYGSVRRILFGACNGMKVRLTPDTGHSMLTGYEKENQGFLRSRIEPGSTVYDVGAHCGEMTLLFARAVTPGGCVVSFEPVAHLCDQLESNVKLNGFKNVQCQRVALGDRNASADFQSSRKSSFMGKLLNAEPTLVFEDPVERAVEVRTLDSFLGQIRPPSLIKIDTEGSAGAVLRGGPLTLRGHGPLLFIALHGPQESGTVQEVLDEQGYLIEDTRGHRVRDLRKEDMSHVWCRKDRS